MTISIQEQIFSINVDENLFKSLTPMPSEFDIRINRTDKMIEQKKQGLFFASENLVRVEQPWLVYEEEGQKYILNGVTRYLALQELWNSDDTQDVEFAPVPYMVLEDGWTEDDLKSLQHSANNFGTNTEEIIIAEEAVRLYNDQYELELDKASKEKDDKGKLLKGRKLTDTASLRATETVLCSPIFRGKTLRHFRRYNNVITTGTDKLIDFIKQSIITLRRADELLVDYRKYTKAFKNLTTEEKSLDYILDALLADSKAEVDAANIKIQEEFDKLPDDEKQDSEPEFKSYQITLEDIKKWFKANTPKKGKNDVTETGESSDVVDTDDDGDNTTDSKVITDEDLAAVNRDFEIVRNHGMTYQRTEEDAINRGRQLVEVLRAQLELSATALDALQSQDIDPVYDSLFASATELINKLPKINENTSKLPQIVRGVKKYKKAIDNFVTSTATAAANEMTEVGDTELNEEIDGYKVNVK